MNELLERSSVQAILAIAFAGAVIAALFTDYISGGEFIAIASGSIGIFTGKKIAGG